MKNIKVMKIISLFNGLVFFAPVALLVRTQRGITTSEFFILQAILSVGIFLFEIPSGYMADRIGYRKTLIISQVFLFLARVLLWIANHFVWFLLEAVVEAVAFSLSSGTLEAAIYCETPQQYGEETAKISNYGTISFIISTLLYSPIFLWFGLDGLLIATVISSFFGMVTIFFLQEKKDCKFVRKKVDKKVTNKKFLVNIGIMSILKSACSVGFFVVNFFYVVKLQQVGINVAWMSTIIMTYSLVQIFVPKCIKIAKKKGTIRQIIFFVSFITTSIFFYLAISTGFLNLFFMVLLPMFLMMIDIELSELENKYIDSFQQEENRATILSLSSMGQNIMDVVFLLGANFFSVLSVNSSFYIAGFGSFIIVLSMMFYKKYNEKCI